MYKACDLALVRSGTLRGPLPRQRAKPFLRTYFDFCNPQAPADWFRYFEMASLKYNNPPGASTTYGDQCHYSQTVDLGNGFVKCAGQGGWDFETGELDASDSTKQVQLAIENVDKILQAAGLRGWEDVYMFRSYHTDISATFELVIEGLKKRIPDHKPVWTCIAVPHLALPTMLIEIEVEAKRQD